jgi:hypothetical protein
LYCWSGPSCGLNLTTDLLLQDATPPIICRGNDWRWALRLRLHKHYNLIYIPIFHRNCAFDFGKDCGWPSSRGAELRSALLPSICGASSHCLHQQHAYLTDRRSANRDRESCAFFTLQTSNIMASPVLQLRGMHRSWEPDRRDEYILYYGA